MNPTPKGKIGRLPLALREQVNRRLHDGQTAKSIADWLNGLPEVQTILAEQFHRKCERRLKSAAGGARKVLHPLAEGTNFLG